MLLVVEMQLVVKYVSLISLCLLPLESYNTYSVPVDLQVLIARGASITAENANGYVSDTLNLNFKIND